MLRVAALLLLAACTRPRQAEPPAREDESLSFDDPAALGLQPLPLASLGEAVAGDEFPRLLAALVVWEGKLVHEAYFHGQSRDVLHDTRSAMKSITSLAVGLALEDGLLESVATLVPVPGAISIEDLLTMSSPLLCNDDDPDSPGNEERMYPQSAWVRWAARVPVDPAYRRDPSGRGRFSYCTAGVVLLGHVVEKAAGEALDRYLDRRLFLPMGIDRREWPRSPSGEIMAGGGLRLRAIDQAKLGWMVRSRGRWHGVKVVPEHWIDLALTVHRRADAEREYGYLFWRRHFASRCGPMSAWFMSGNGGNLIVIFERLPAVLVVNTSNYNRPGMHPQSIRVIEEHLLAALPCERAR